MPEPRPGVLWHGVSGMKPSEEFLVRGGTSMGLLSATPDRRVAERYASRDSGSAPALLLKLSLPNLARSGASVAFLSCFPQEQEVVYGPCTYLRPIGRPEVLVSTAVTTRADGQGGVRLSWRLFRVVEVVPLPRTAAD